MRIIHSGGFPIDERRQTRAVIYSNMIVAFKLLIEIMEAENISFEHEATEVCMNDDISSCRPVPFVLVLCLTIAYTYIYPTYAELAQN